MLVQSAITLAVWGLTVAVVFGELDEPQSPRIKRASSFRSQTQAKSKNDEDVFHSGFHNILPNYRTPAKYCYQCAYSPPRSYASNEKQTSTKTGGSSLNTKTSLSGAILGRLSSNGNGKAVRNGGWDKCLGPFDELQAAEYGVDVWQCHSNCYTRRDPNGDIFRGCFKGEYGVDPSMEGCHYQSGSMYCFCDVDRCNSGPVSEFVA